MSNQDPITSPFNHLSALSYLHGAPVANGCIRAQAEDFFVQETLSFTPSGEGEHLFLYIEKREANTQWVAQQLAKHFSVRSNSVAWAGLKDRNAVTQQWFSVHLPGMTSLEALPVSEQFKVLEHTFNNRKLRVGAIANNFFRLRVTSLKADADRLQQRLDAIAEQGVPNYFGEQRFGRNGNNLNMAQALLIDGKRFKKADQSMAISAARSYVFNQVLDQRIQAGLFNRVQGGDALMLDKTKSLFIAHLDELAELQQRLECGDCHTSAVMPGCGEGLATGVAQDWEFEQLKPFADWLQGLEKLRVSASRRAVRLIPEGFNWQLDSDELLLEFRLPTGAYATSVLREFLSY